MNIQQRIIPIQIESTFVPTLNIQEIYKQFQKDFQKAISNAEQELITQIATELNASEKCAIYFINRHFNVTLRVNTPDRINETPTFDIVAEPKSVEEILNRSDDDKPNMECEKQLLENK